MQDNGDEERDNGDENEEYEGRYRTYQHSFIQSAGKEYSRKTSMSDPAQLSAPAGISLVCWPFPQAGSHHNIIWRGWLVRMAYCPRGELLARGLCSARCAGSGRRRT